MGARGGIDVGGAKIQAVVVAALGGAVAATLLLDDARPRLRRALKSRRGLT